MARDAPALRVDGRRVDAAAFYAAACDPARSCVVEACAGSGKTWMLVSRMLRALLDGTPPHEILAITFTRAAAGEMRERLDLWLHDFATARSSHGQRVQALVERGVDAARAEALAPELGTLQVRVLAAGRPVEIRTFHGWFAQLMRAAPLALLDRLGVHGDAELVEDWREHRGAVHRAFHEVLLRDPALRADHAALTARRGRQPLRTWLDAVWDRRVEFELADAAGVLATSVERADELWPELAAWSHPAESIATPAWTELLRAAARELASARGKLARDAGAELAAALSLAPERRYAAAWATLFTLTDDKARAFARGLPIAESAQAALEHLAGQVHQHEAREEHLRMVRLGRALLAALAEYKRVQGLADMADLERVALALLGDGELSGWVHERLDARVAHLLIDEFQDTSPLQWHALHGWLAGYAGAGGGASGQRPPGVFIVGDPKQSIYRFRRAEPRVFAAAAAFVREGLGGSVLACDHTRRNAPRVIEAINGVFAAAGADFEGFRRHTTELGAGVAGDAAVLARIDRPPRAPPARRGADAEAPVWRDSLTTPRLVVDEVLREREAEAVAEAVAAAIGAGTPAREIYVLCRRRHSLRLVALALERRHVGHSAVEDAMLAETTEAQDLIALLDALVSTGHDLSLARALRSPLFGASDLDLLALRERAAAGASWWRALRELDDASPALARARELLGRWHALVAALPPHDLLDRIVVESDAAARYAAAVPPEQRAFALDAIDAVVAQSLALDGGRYATPYAFVRALKQRAVRAALPVRSATVRLLTVHGAKGLEADTVFVMDSEPERANPPLTTLLVEWPVEAPMPTRCAFVYNENRCPPSLRAALGDEMRAREREELNGLYVAMSRAKRRLVFSATEPYLAPTGPTWWSRVAAVATPAGAPRQGELGFDAPEHAAAPAPELAIATLPSWRGAAVAAVAAPATAAATVAARIGRAVHRALEWIVADPGLDRGAAADAAAHEFIADAALVRRRVDAIVDHPDGARFFRGPQIRWSGNEVAIGDGGAGEVLRIDRLVLVDDDGGPAWWVLDYKLAHAPEQLAPYREQLRRYRDAVARAQPGETVRSAFVAGDGRIVEVA